jgi:hypothetical protein
MYSLARVKVSVPGRNMLMAAWLNNKPARRPTTTHNKTIQTCFISSPSFGRDLENKPLFQAPCQIVPVVTDG